MQKMAKISRYQCMGVQPRWRTVQLYALAQKLCFAKCQASVDMQVLQNLSRVMGYHLLTQLAGRKVRLLRQPTLECQNVAELTTPTG